MKPAIGLVRKPLWFRAVFWAGVVCLQFWLSSRGFALDPAKDLNQYNCQTWSRQNGLMVNGVNAITQTPDGYLWLGTSSGLYRYDGSGFSQMRLARSGNNYVTSLAGARNGGLWVGLENNAVVFYDDDVMAVRTNVPSVKSDWSNHSLQADPDGTLWIVANHHLARQSPAGAYEELVSFPDDQAINLMCGFKDSQGRFWYGTADEGVFYWLAGTVHKLEAPELDGVIIFTIVEDHDGNIWIGTADGLFCYDTRLRRKDISPLTVEIRALLVDQHGVLWLGTSTEGLARYQNGRYDFFHKADGLPSNFVKSLVEDSEGSLWIGTRNGVSQLTDVKFPTFRASDNPNGQDAMAVYASRKGGVWVASTAGITYLDHQSKTYGTESGLPNSLVKRVLEAGNGDVYLVSGSKDLAVFSGDKVVATHSATNMIVGMVEDAKGVVVSVGGYLYRAGKNYFTPYAFTNDNQPPLYWVLNLAPGRDGVIWAATVNGIFRIKDGAFQHWTTAQGLTDNRVEWICEDGDGVVWASMPTGIARLQNNQIRCISENNGLFDDNVYAIVPDDLGNLWVDAGRGISRISRQSLQDFAEGRTQRVDSTAYDGLNSVKPADKTIQERVGCKSLDGRIWFPGANGVLAINPRQITTNQVVPPVRLQSIRANGQEYPRSEQLIVPPGNGELQFGFAAMSFIAPQKIRFRYQLEGYDKGWVDAESRHLAFYTNLKPGRYTFRVIAANADDVWNQRGDAVVIELRPHFYQTGGFYILCGGLMLFGSVMGYRGYVRRVKVKQAKLLEARDKLEAEIQHRTAELAHERHLLRVLLDNAPDHIYFKDLQSRFIQSGQAQAQHFGVKGVEAILGKTDADFFAEEHARLAFEDEQEIIHTGRTITGKVEKEVWKDGREAWVLSNKMPLRDQSGQIIGTFGVSKDITLIKQAEAELAYERDLLRNLLDNAPDKIYFKDARSRIIKAGNAVARQFGVASPEALAGKSDFDFFSEEHARPAFEDEQQIIRTGEPIVGKIEKEAWNDGRQESWVLTTKMPLRDQSGKIIGTFGISKDITAIKEAESQLKEVHRQLLEISRQAGMAEVATNVLHNVGNVLNSVNVSATLVLDTAKASKISNLARVVALLDEHAADLGAFMTTDPKGQQLPVYLSQLAGQLAKDQEQVIREMELLRQNIEHIKDIVAMQQSYAKISGVTETVRVAGLVEDALAMNAGALTRHEVELIREFSEVPPVTVEKHKVLQILVNLIRNAKYACDDSGRPDKKITLQISQAASGVRIVVIDNGVGILPENLTRIFNHGFTTRNQGHGFGLHSSALAAKEMGGSLSVHSAGPGQGAAFTLELPAQPNEDSNG